MIVLEFLLLVRVISKRKRMVNYDMSLPFMPPPLLFFLIIYLKMDSESCCINSQFLVKAEILLFQPAAE